ncbi:MAG: BolA family transcriptional regulator [Alphaproteobacteria bacterium]|nr:BolA family transcriptional regulator [Alphaproteobacteria bacterium]
MSITERINKKLTEGLTPTVLEVVDESAKHKGHGGWREGGETHYHVTVVADAFEGKSRVDRQRMVYALLAEEMAERVHALALTTKTPGEV